MYTSSGELFSSVNTLQDNTEVFRTGLDTLLNLVGMFETHFVIVRYRIPIIDPPL